MGISIDNIKIKPKPDFSRLLKAFKRKEMPDRVPFFEIYSNIEEAVAGGKVKKSECKNDLEYAIKLTVEHNYRLGYDYCWLRSPFYFERPGRHGGLTTEGKRDYIQSEDSLIKNDEEFEKYPWQDMNKVDYSRLDIMKNLLPEGMKIIPRSPGGVFENTTWIMGFTQFSFALVENPGLIKKVVDAIGARQLSLLKTYASHEAVGAVLLGEDMGFKTSTMISPDMMREYFFPWHKKIVDAVHSYGKPALIHSCGNLTEIYQDILACGWDAKHSFEDGILPVWEFKKQYGKEIACLGGFDMDKICRFSPEEIRKHTRSIIDKCAPGGGYAFGTGNSVAQYVPAENYLTMIEEAFNYR